MRKALGSTRKRLFAVALVAVVGAIAVGTALGTPSSGVTAETYRGNVQGQLNLFTQFSPGVSARIKTKGAFEIVVQKIVAEPGATFGWHYHPGENVNVVAQGTLSLYHAKKCTLEITHPTGSGFTTSPDEVHLARNEGTDTLIIYATYLVPKSSPPLPLRIDQPSPGPGCPL
jgi:quercetin dioxygenase-like cupin family protein